MDRGEKQLYGSQVVVGPVTKKQVVHPIEDEPNVNKRRATIGPGPIEKYARNFGIDYIVPGDRVVCSPWGKKGARSPMRDRRLCRGRA